MAFCSRCGSEIPEGTAFCPTCGTPVGAAPVAPSVADPYDHTAEFTEEEIKEGRIFAMMCYLTGLFGVLITYIACKDNGFAKFHARQSLNIYVATLLCCTLGLIPCCLGLVAALVLGVICWIQFFSSACGHAKETAILRSMGCFKL